VAKFSAVVGDVVWLDWAEEGRELVALSDDGRMARWPRAAAQPIDASGFGGDEHSDNAPAGPNGVPYRGNDCGSPLPSKIGTPYLRKLATPMANGWCSTRKSPC
jgi:hypothetical protein